MCKTNGQVWLSNNSKRTHTHISSTVSPKQPNEPDETHTHRHQKCSEYGLRLDCMMGDGESQGGWRLVFIPVFILLGFGAASWLGHDDLKTERWCVSNVAKWFAIVTTVSTTCRTELCFVQKSSLQFHYSFCQPGVWKNFAPEIILQSVLLHHMVLLPAKSTVYKFYSNLHKGVITPLSHELLMVYHTVASNHSS